FHPVANDPFAFRRRPMADAALFPRVHAMVVCDEIERVAGQDGVYNLRGVRTRIMPGQYPYVHPKLCVYMHVSGRQGNATFHLKVIAAADDAVVASTPEKRTDLEGPLVLVPVRWYIRRCRFPQPGLYYIQVELGSKLINERLVVLTTPTGLTNGEPAH